jgi:formylglycine-generating enzyme required for sulfatase activity
METEAMPAVERVRAGVTLAHLGDPRAEVMKVAQMALCEVPAGRFKMGSRHGAREAIGDEQPQHDVELPAFRIGKYPVTNAQFGSSCRRSSQTRPHSPGEELPRNPRRHIHRAARRTGCVCG